MGAFIVSAAFILGVGVVIAKVSSGKRKQRETSWRNSASGLGLSFSSGPHSERPIRERHYLPQMYGTHDGQEVYVGVRTYTTGSGKNRQTHYYTFVDAVLDPPLKRGLSVRRAGGVSQFFGSVFGQRDIQIGDATFDKEHRIDGLDAAQVSELLLFGSLRGLLSRDFSQKFEPSITDDRVRVEARGIITDLASLTPQVDAVVGLYRETIQSWRALSPSAPEVAITASWERVASTRGLEFDARSMVIAGAIDGMRVHGEVVLDHDSGNLRAAPSRWSCS